MVKLCDGFILGAQSRSTLFPKLFSRRWKQVLGYSALSTDPVLPSPAPEILDYLARHPDAQDTIDGILHWWVLDACIRRWAPKITETVALLVEQGVLEQKLTDDGRVFYRASSRQRAAMDSPR